MVDTEFKYPWRFLFGLCYLQVFLQSFLHLQDVVHDEPFRREVYPLPSPSSFLQDPSNYIWLHFVCPPAYRSLEGELPAIPNIRYESDKIRLMGRLEPPFRFKPRIPVHQILLSQVSDPSIVELGGEFRSYVRGSTLGVLKEEPNEGYPSLWMAVCNVLKKPVRPV